MWACVWAITWEGTNGEFKLTDPDEVSLADDITCDLHTLNEIDENELELTDKFMKYVQLHSEAKQLRKFEKNCSLEHRKYSNQS